MANKQNGQIQYGSMAIPSKESRLSILRWGWRGINRTDTVDTGSISDCSGVTVNDGRVSSVTDFGSLPVVQGKVIGIYGVDDFILIIYRDTLVGNDLVLLQVANPGKENSVYIKQTLNSNSDDMRTVVQFNTTVTGGNILTATYVRKLLIYPDMVSVPMEYDEKTGIFLIGAPEVFETEENPQPNLKEATVFSGRLFGVDDNMVFASEFNNYSSWRLDTADEISESNAWVSMTQSNSKADGIFTAICVYDNHVVLFKKDFTQLVYGDNNPFRIVDLVSYGADNRNAVAEAQGILYFVSKDNVYAFTGGIPKAIGDELHISDYSGACLGYFKDKLYMCVGKKLYMYRNGTWTATDLKHHIVMFATCDFGLYGLMDAGHIEKIDSNEQEMGIGAYERDWWFETDLMCGGKLDIRRAKKISVLCDLAEGASVSVYLLKNGEEFDPETSEKVIECNKVGKSVARGMLRGFSGFCHKLRICGKGKATIHAAELLISWGGDLYRNE